MQNKSNVPTKKCIYFFSKKKGFIPTCRFCPSRNLAIPEPEQKRIVSAPQHGCRLLLGYLTMDLIQIRQWCLAKPCIFFIEHHFLTLLFHIFTLCAYCMFRSFIFISLLSFLLQIFTHCLPFNFSLTVSALRGGEKDFQVCTPLQAHRLCLTKRSQVVTISRHPHSKTGYLHCIYKERHWEQLNIV
jgi:hypothetical protein